jgi:isoquinoline 1-oxidoreductase subunit beta
MGLSAALAEKITLEHGQVVQRNFPDYPLLRLSQSPKLETYFLDSDAPLGGLGEMGVPPVAPALCNALFAATGKRIRTLPILGSEA